MDTNEQLLQFDVVHHVQNAIKAIAELVGVDAQQIGKLQSNVICENNGKLTEEKLADCIFCGSWYELLPDKLHRFFFLLFQYIPSLQEENSRMRKLLNRLYKEHKDAFRQETVTSVFTFQQTTVGHCRILLENGRELHIDTGYPGCVHNASYEVYEKGKLVSIIEVDDGIVFGDHHAFERAVA